MSNLIKFFIVLLVGFSIVTPYSNVVAEDLGILSLEVNETSTSIDIDFDDISRFDEFGIAIISKTDADDNIKYGLMSNEGELLLDSQYDSISDFDDHFYIIWKGEYFGFYSKEMKRVDLDCVYSANYSITSLSDVDFLQMYDENGNSKCIMYSYSNDSDMLSFKEVYVPSGIVGAGIRKSDGKILTEIGDTYYLQGMSFSSAGFSLEMWRVDINGQPVDFDDNGEVKRVNNVDIYNNEYVVEMTNTNGYNLFRINEDNKTLTPLIYQTEFMKIDCIQYNCMSNTYYIEYYYSDTNTYGSYVYDPVSNSKTKTEVLGESEEDINIIKNEIKQIVEATGVTVDYVNDFEGNYAELMINGDSEFTYVKFDLNNYDFSYVENKVITSDFENIEYFDKYNLYTKAFNKNGFSNDETVLDSDLSYEVKNLYDSNINLLLSDLYEFDNMDEDDFDLQRFTVKKTNGEVTVEITSDEDNGDENQSKVLSENYLVVYDNGSFRYVSENGYENIDPLSDSSLIIFSNNTNDLLYGFIDGNNGVEISGLDYDSVINMYNNTEGTSIGDISFNSDGYIMTVADGEKGLVDAYNCKLLFEPIYEEITYDRYNFYLKVDDNNFVIAEREAPELRSDLMIEGYDNINLVSKIGNYVIFSNQINDGLDNYLDYGVYNINNGSIFLEAEYSEIYYNQDEDLWNLEKYNLTSGSYDNAVMRTDMTFVIPFNDSYDSLSSYVDGFAVAKSGEKEEEVVSLLDIFFTRVNAENDNFMLDIVDEDGKVVSDLSDDYSDVILVGNNRAFVKENGSYILANISKKITPYIRVESVDILSDSITLDDENESKQLISLILPSSYNESVTEKWTSSNESVVTVDSNGKVTKVNSGSATITYTVSGAEEHSDIVAVKVNAPVEDESVDSDDVGDEETSDVVINELIEQTPEPAEKPVVAEINKEVIDIVVDYIKRSSDIVVSLSENLLNEQSDKLLLKGTALKEALKSGKSIEVTIDNGVKWIFNSESMTNTLIDTNLNVKIDENPDGNYEELKDGNYEVIEFEHQGDLPGDVIIELSVSDKFANGDLLDLYYINPENGVLELYKKDLKIVDGKVSFTINHCSSYILSKSEVELTNEVVTNDNNGEEENITFSENSNNLIYLIGSMAIALLAIVIYFKKKKSSNNI